MNHKNNNGELMKFDLDFLKQFCSKHDTREFLLKPFSKDGFIYVCNGYLAIRILDDGYLSVDSIKKEPISALFEVNFHMNEGLDFPELPVAIQCSECEGTGFSYRTDCDECEGGNFWNGSFEYECKNCLGIGSLKTDEKIDPTQPCWDCSGHGVQRHQPIEIQGHLFNRFILDLIRKLPNSKITFIDDFKMRFVFDGGVGIAMGTR